MVFFVVNNIQIKLIKAIEERTLQFMFNNKTSTYSSLSENVIAQHNIQHVKAMASEVFKI